jgi:hypothetical protein
MARASVLRTPGGQIGPSPRHAHDIGVVEHDPIERDMLGLAKIVELLAHARADLLGDLGGVDRAVEAAADREQPLQLAQIGFDGGLHVGILQLARQLGAVERAGAVHLAERRGGGRMVLEVFELFLPVRAELGEHAALDEGPAHRRRFALQLLQFGGVFGQQQIRNGREQLRDLHQRALEPAERRRQRQRLAGAVRRAAKKPPPRITRRHAAHIGADPRIARGACRQTVLFAVGRHGLLYSGEPGRQSTLRQFFERLTIFIHAFARDLHRMIVRCHSALDFQTILKLIHAEDIAHSPTKSTSQFNRKIDE